MLQVGKIIWVVLFSFIVKIIVITPYKLWDMMHQVIIIQCILRCLCHLYILLILTINFAGEIPYYIIRNTWGTSFGLDGYLHVAIGKNLCGIAEEISAVDVIL